MNRPIVALPQQPAEPPQGQQAQQPQPPAAQPIQQAIQPFAPPDGGAISSQVQAPMAAPPPSPAWQPAAQPFASPDPGAAQFPAPGWAAGQSPTPQGGMAAAQPLSAPDPAAAAQIPPPAWPQAQQPMASAGAGGAQPFASPDPAAGQAPSPGWGSGQAHPLAAPDPAAATAAAAAQIPSSAWPPAAQPAAPVGASGAQPFASPDPAAAAAAAQMPSPAWAPAVQQPAAPAGATAAQAIASPEAAAAATAAAQAPLVAWAPAAALAATPRTAPRKAASRAKAQPAKARGTGVRIGLAQILCWQLALVGVAVAANGPLGVLLGTSAAAVGLVALTAVPVRGAWPHQWAGIATRYLLRRRRAELPESTPASNADVASALLEPWLGRTTFDATAVRERPLALVSNQAAVSALLRLDPSESAGSGGSGVGAALSCLLQPDAGLLDTLDEQATDVEIQLVVHAGLRHDSQPRGWIAIAASRTHDLSSDARLTMLVKNASRRVLRHLERTGTNAAQVDDQEAATTLVSLAHANAGRGHVRERWTTWSAGPVSQACLRLAGFTKLQPGAASALIEALAGTAVQASVTISVSACVAAATQGQQANSVERREPVVRVAAASAGALDVAITVLGRLVRAYGAHPERLEGRHGPGVAASLPIARTLV